MDVTIESEPEKQVNCQISDKTFQLSNVEI